MALASALSRIVQPPRFMSLFLKGLDLAELWIKLARQAEAAAFPTDQSRRDPGSPLNANQVVAAKMALRP